MKDNVVLIGFIILGLLFVISIPFISSSGNSGSDVNISGFDSNKVMVSSNDTTAGYLNGKLVAGSNITLTENNDGGNETLTIASTASGGGSDTNCSTSADCNNMYIRKNPIGSETIFHGNGEQLIISQDGNVSNSTSIGGAVLIENTDNNGAGLIIYSNAGSEANGRLLNIRADNNGFDQPAGHIDYDGTANVFEIVNNGTDTSSQSLNVVSNNPNDTTLGINGVETSKGTLKIVHNVAGGDSSASAISIDLQGTGTESQGIYLDSTASGGTTGDLLRLRNQTIDRFVVTKDGNAHSKGDVNGLRLCINNDCRNTWPTTGGATDGNGSILGTANQVNVTNGLSRLFGDSNVVLSLPQNIDTSASPTFTELTLTLGVGSCFNVNVGAQQRFNVDCTTNTTTSGTNLPNQPSSSDLGNATTRWDDLWITDINATGTSDFNNLTYDGQDVLTEVDGNSLYLKLNGVGNQTLNSTVANGLDLNFTTRPSIALTYDLGSGARRFDEVYARQFNANPGTGQPALFAPANSAFACGTNTDICIDFNNGTKSFNYSDTNEMIFGWGVVAVDYGVVFEKPSATEVMFSDYDRDGTRLNIIDGTKVIPKIYYEGRYNIIGSNQIDLNVTDDLNVSGDGNFHTDIKVDGNMYGQLIVTDANAGTSCTNQCASWTYGGPWACVESRDYIGNISTCASTISTRDCMCRN